MARGGTASPRHPQGMVAPLRDPVWRHASTPKRENAPPPSRSRAGGLFSKPGRSAGPFQDAWRIDTSSIQTGSVLAADSPDLLMLMAYLVVPAGSFCAKVSGTQFPSPVKVTETCTFPRATPDESYPKAIRRQENPAVPVAYRLISGVRSEGAAMKLPLG